MLCADKNKRFFIFCQIY